MKRMIKANTTAQITDWHTLEIGQKLMMISDEFDGYSETPCTVTSVEEDHAIATEDCEVGRPQTLWIDDFNQDMFVYR